MRKGWTESALPAIVEVLDRMRQPISAIEREKRLGDVPYYGANGQAGWIDESIFDETLVLLGEDAIDFLNPDASKAYLITGPSWVNNHAHVLRVDPKKVLSFFLAEALNRVDYSQYVAFGTRSKLTQGSMKGIKILMPPLQEQKRIVDLISSVDSFIDALQQQADSARTARGAVLHELLSAGGDGWIETTLGEVAKCAGGNAFPLVYQNGQTGIPFIKVSDMNIPGNETEIISALNYITPELAKKLKVRVWPVGTVIFPKVGAALLTDKRRILARDTIFDNNIMGLIGRDMIIHRFLFLFMTRIRMSEYFQSGALPSISNGIVSEIEISLPPLQEQKRIVDLISSFDEVISISECAKAEIKNLRSGLLSDLLSGEHEIPESYDLQIGLVS